MIYGWATSVYAQHEGWAYTWSLVLEEKPDARPHLPELQQPASVKEEYAGRGVACPTCRTQMVIPSLAVPPPLPPVSIPGPEWAFRWARQRKKVKIGVAGSWHPGHRSVRVAPQWAWEAWSA